MNSYIFLLFMYVTNLEPNVLLGKWTRRIIHNVFEALYSKLVIITSFTFSKKKPHL
jgi:hypothetical protein